MNQYGSVSQVNQYPTYSYDHYYLRYPYIAFQSSSQPSSSSKSSEILLPRGPPKKPWQSGHALWVGNLPYNTQLMELCKLFGTNDILSVFLIGKTKCAFVNYKTSKAAEEGNSVFKKRGGKLRGNTLLVKIKDSPDEIHRITSSLEPSSINASQLDQISQRHVLETKLGQPKDRFFICKSLTEEDLRASLRLGIWSTQSHNEEAFNNAFRCCDNVYIFFSANRARSFFGYARMESEIPHNHNSNLALGSISDPSWGPVSHPNTIETQPDPRIPLPAGRIVDDSSRGCLFWEATDNNQQAYGGYSGSNWTLPFRVRLLSPLGKILPFERTSHLFNSCNEGKPVKIARDGTEVSYEVGKRLVQLFDE
ncbi:hypothetical protein AWJ20_1876 [Sugiyamaella lignohabitans]|uniref:YTH domain-containing protein n=1 Tax=Sugiyamaella lignohabitans TaxID=796027 RepID=A0A167E308_9ASCO|nr:uncharacterized protein AWJ20_1876 [Sugiyamaella lignohabitans]ANB13579.1 hypothetical protein AWJ20_1876 [Sugiyamaella lignohabitans]